MKLVRLDTMKEGDRCIMPIFFEGEHVSSMMLIFNGVYEKDISYCKVSIFDYAGFEKSNTLIEKYEELK